MTSRLRAMLMRDEGVRLTVYDDATGQPLLKGDTLKGNPTIGVGRELSAHGISRAECDELLASDIERCREEARQYDWYHGLSDARRAVVVCMIFQMGAAGFERFRNTHAALDSGNFELAAEHMLDSLWAEQTPARAERLAEQMATGEWT